MIDLTGLETSVATILPPVTGRGGGKSGDGPSNDRNTMRSRARANLIEAISEGPIWGLVNGDRSIYFDQTPLLNADGTYNFKDVQATLHKGYADEGYFTGHSAVETPFSVETQVKASLGPTVRTIVDENADAVRVIVRIPSLVQQDDKGGLKKTDLSYSIDVRGYNGTWQEMVRNDLNNQKALSPFQIAHRVPLPQNGSPWDIRVRRNTPDSTDDKLQNDLYFEGYIVLVEGKFIYPHTAAMAIELNAEEMGTTVPPRYYHVKGLLINVPSNYNPETRTYTGIWNGTFKIAWTNNPAWIFYDLLVNDRYGLGEFINPAIIDKWSLYTIAQYCDQLVKSGYKNGDTGADIWEPRYTYNGVINSRDEAFFVLQTITKSWRGMAYWAIGQVFATADMPSDPVRLVTPANVIDGRFEYSGTAIKARHSVVMVKWNNPDDFYRPDTELVIDTDLLQKYGWRDKSVQLQGCTSRGLAHRYGKWIIDTEKNETDTVTYSASWDHAQLRPGDIIAISDPKRANVRAAGRIVSHDNLTVTLDADFEWNTGQSYQLMLTMPDGKVETKPILAFLDNHTVRVSAAYSQTALADAVFTIKGSDITPRLFRVLVVDESEPNIFKITALFHDPLKFARVESDIAFTPLPYERPPATTPAPTNLQVKEQGYVSGGKNYHSLTLSWTADPNYPTRGFAVSVDTPDNGTLNLGTTQNAYIEMTGIAGGIYTFYVQAIGYTGIMSRAASVQFTATGPEGYQPPTVTDLELVDRAGENFVGRDIRVRWKNNFALYLGGPLETQVSPHYDHNTVKVYHGVTGVLLRTDKIYTSGYLYNYETNQADCAAHGYPSASRSIRIEVTVTDVFNRTSPVVSRTFINYVPDAIAPTYSVEGRTIFMSFPPVSDLDFAGFLIWRSTTPGIDVDTEEPYLDGTSNYVQIVGLPATTYYFRVAAYDAFGRAGLNHSSEFSVATEYEVGLEPPAVPTGLALSSEIVNHQARLIVTWNANTEADLSAYDIQIKQGAGNWVSFPVASGPYELDAISGVIYTARIRARNRDQNASEYSAEVSHTVIADSDAPDTPTGLSAVAGVTSVWLKWTNPNDADLDHIEILESATNDPLTGVVIARTASDAFARTGLGTQQRRYYWVRSVDTSGNKSELTASVTATTTALPAPNRLQFTGLLIKPNDPDPNKVSWGAASAIYGPPGFVPTTKAIAAGSATWTSGSLYLYYVENTLEIRATTDLNTLYGSSGYPIAIYRGGNDLQMADGQVILDGNNILAGTIGAQQLVVNDAIITNSLQLKDAVITSAKVEDLDAAKLRAGSAIAGSVTVSGRTLGSVANVDTLFDNFDQDWQEISGVGTFEYSTAAADVSTGSRSLKAHADGSIWVASPNIVAFDPAKLYKITYRVKRISGVDGTMSLGLVGYKADKTTKVNTAGADTLSSSHLLFTQAQADVDTGYSDYIAYVKGTAAAPDTKVNISAVGVPGMLHSDVRYFQMLAIFNTGMADGGAVMAIERVNIEVVDPDAASIVNAGLTQIDPGKILIAGATTLADWRMGGDNTRINGGLIAANTVKANSLEIGQRNITVDGITFEHNSPSANKVSWTAGKVNYTSDAGLYISSNIEAGFATWTSGMLYVFWEKGTNTLQASNDMAIAGRSTNVIIASYAGGVNLIAQYGRTIVDGGLIKTGTIQAAQVAAQAISTEKLAANAVTANQLAANSVTADKVAARAITADKISANSLSAISAVLGTVDISSAYIGSLTVGTSNIAGGAVTSVATTTGGSMSVTGTNQLYMAVSVYHGIGAGTVLVWADFDVRIGQTGGQNGTTGYYSAYIYCYDTGASNRSKVAAFTPPYYNTSTTYYLYLSGSAATISNGVMIAMAAKR